MVASALRQPENEFVSHVDNSNHQKQKYGPTIYCDDLVLVLYCKKLQALHDPIVVLSIFS